MTRFNKALFASASLLVMASAAQAADPVVVIGPGSTTQNLPGVDTWDPINLTNLVGATVQSGKGFASSEAFQINAITLNQFGAVGSEVSVIGDYTVTQSYTYGTGGENISVLNSNGAFTPGGISTVSGSQIISTQINNVAVKLANVGQDFDVIQSFTPNVGGGRIAINQQNSMTAGYDTNNDQVGTGGAFIIGKELDTNTGTNHSGLQVNSLSINTAAVDLVPAGAASVKIAQTFVLNGAIDLFNVADAGAQSSTLPPPPGGGVIDPSITNLQQIAALTVNSATVTGATTSDINLEAAFDTGTIPYTAIPNQSFSGVAGTTNLYNVAHALTWAPGTYAVGNEWVPFGTAGKGDVNIGGPLAADKSGGVKQIAAWTVNSVTGPTADAGTAPNTVNIYAGTVNADFTDNIPNGLTAFSQNADLTNVTFGGRTNPAVGGAGVLNSFVDVFALAASDGFPSWGAAGPIPVVPADFSWAGANNTAIAGTGQGNATIQNLDQIAAISVNNFSFDNATRDADGNVTVANTDILKGAVDQFATLGGVVAPKEYQLANLAVAVTGKGTATLDTVNQTNVFSVNAVTAGAVDFTGTVVSPIDPTTNYDVGHLDQQIVTNGAVLNLGNAAVAYGNIAKSIDTKQVNAVSLNTATINSVQGGSITQSTLGGVNVNAGNYLAAYGLNTASITNASQVNVVNVNSIVGQAVK
jgi:hypothetical protein